MDKNKKRIDGHRVAVAVITVAVIVAAGGFFLFFKSRSDEANLTGLLPPDCEEQEISNPECRPSVASGQTPPSVIEGDDLEGDDLGGAHAASSEAEMRKRSPRRAWQQQANASNLRSGRTLVELCTNSGDIDPLPCQARFPREMFAFGSTATAKHEESRHVISGDVLSAHGEPLGDVAVVASPQRLDDADVNESESLRYWTKTDSLGAYSIAGLPAGEYTVRSARHGQYHPARISVRAGVDYADLVMDQNLELLIGGRVTNESGEPLEGVTVFPKLLGQRSVQSGPDGRFELPVSVKPLTTSLALSVQAPGYKDQSKKIRIGTYPARVDEDVSIVMDAVHSWTSLTGSVSDDVGQPLAGYRVELSSSTSRKTQHTSTDESGRYTFTFVESPADYELLVLGGAAFKDAEKYIHVTTDMKEVDLVTEAYGVGTVAGRLLNQSGMPIADFDLVLRNVESRESNAVVTTDSLGNFEISAPAGEVVMSSLSTPTVLVQGLHIEPGDRVYLPMVLDWGDHSIRGLVIDSKGNPVPASRVILNWSRRDDQLNTLATRRTATDSQGQFAFTNLGPGPHSLKVDAPGFPGVEIDHDLSRQGYDLTVRLN
jgi:protocatechuate 3,4-dioxygenase beta subunit